MLMENDKWKIPLAYGEHHYQIFERYFVLQEKVPDKQSSSYSETLLGLRENATGEPGALQTLQTLPLQLYAATIVSISKLRNSSFETKVRLDIIAPRLGAYFDLTQQQQTFE